MKNILPALTFVLFFQPSFSQIEQVKTKIQQKESELTTIKQNLEDRQQEMEQLKLDHLSTLLREMGYPQSPHKGELVEHRAFALEYVEAHEQPAWVFHIISPDIITGNQSRTNDFRMDTLVSTSTAVEQDYFLKHTDESGNTTYDGYGYDRGHLAPSADFRWSKTALSESYFYSNMSPQLPEFNRAIWAELEGLMRDYVYRTGHPLYVVTGGVLKEDLPEVECSINEVSIPEEFYKVIIDTDTGMGIGFIVPHQKSGYKALERYAMSVDEVEAKTGIDFFNELPQEEKIEATASVRHWLPEERKNDVPPLDPTKLPRNTFNTLQAKIYAGTGEKIKVCGTVVSTHKSKKGNVFLNLDRAFPNQVFSVSIWERDMVNFSYAPHIALKNKQVCVTGKVRDYEGTPSMNIDREEAIQLEGFDFQ